MFHKKLAEIRRTDVNVVWRETIPQNFPTVSGHYAFHGFCKEACPCVPLSLSMKLGFGLFPHCEPTCYPANIRNTLTNPIIKASGMPILEVYDALLNAPFNFHRNDFDCTHVASDALIFMNEQFIKFLETKNSTIKRGTGQSFRQLVL